MKQLDFINRSLRQKNESKAYIKNVDKAIVKYYQAFSKGIKSWAPEPSIRRS